ncbi:hypothetical protein L0N00_14935, partial [Eggerthella lenta]|nr:hypothetical protein [Eggerthella lenta]
RNKVFIPACTGRQQPAPKASNKRMCFMKKSFDRCHYPDGLERGNMAAGKANLVRARIIYIFASLRMKKYPLHLFLKII